MNPMIQKELRHRMRDRRGWLLPSLYLLALGGAVALAYFFATSDPWGLGFRQEPQGADIGTKVFLTVTFTQMTLLLLLAPAFTAGALTLEKEQRTMAALLTSLLTPAQIWWGKFVSSILFLVLLVTMGIPVLSLAFALGGVSLKEVAQVTGVTLAVLACMCAVGLYCSSYFRRSIHATAVAYGITISLTVLTFVGFSILTAIYAQTHRASAGAQPPVSMEIVLFFNPFTPLLILTPEDKGPYPIWLLSLQVFVGMACLAAGLAMRNIQRSGEQV